MKTLGKVLEKAKAPTPFKIVKDTVIKGGRGVAKDIGKGIKKGGKAVGKVLHKHFVEPQLRVNRHNAKMDALNKADLKSGKFNTGESSARSQSY